MYSFSNPNPGMVACVFFVVVVAIRILIIMWRFQRGRQILDQWAQGQGFQLVEANYRWVFQGPFFWGHSRGQSVYKIQAIAGAGNSRTGWARCGGWFMGLCSNEVTVVWDDRDAPPADYIDPRS